MGHFRTLAVQDARSGGRRRLRIIAIPPNPSIPSIPGSGVERVLVLKANVAASVDALELFRKSLAVSLAGEKKGTLTN